MSKKALITGVTGQDGSYLAEFLLDKGYEVYGMVRRTSTFNRERIEHLHKQGNSQNFHLIYGDVTDSGCINRLLCEIKPDEIYHLAAQSHVRISFDMPEYTCESTAMSTLHFLEAIRTNKLNSKFYQASSSEMYGKVHAVPQNEETPFHPRSPYACAKVFAHHITVNYRESYGIFACSGILFNHESPRRGENFVTRKITRSLAKILAGKQEKLYLGNLEAKRDWGYAKEYVEAMWLMLQLDKAEDFVIATGETHSVKEFLDEACAYLNIDADKYVEIDERHYRPAEVDLLIGDAKKAEEKLNWKPKTTFKELVKIMVDADLKLEGIEQGQRQA